MFIVYLVQRYGHFDATQLQKWVLALAKVHFNVGGQKIMRLRGVA